MRTDIQTGNEGDLLVQGGDLVIAQSDDEHISEILRAYPGEYKQSPLTGVYLQRALNGSLDGSVRRDIRLNLEADGYYVTNLVFTDTELSIDASYNRK